MAVKKYESAIPLLEPLLKTKEFGGAAVWLQYGECLAAQDRLEEAADAYCKVRDRCFSCVFYNSCPQFYIYNIIQNLTLKRFNNLNTKTNVAALHILLSFWIYISSIKL